MTLPLLRPGSSASPHLVAAPEWRREPYRLLFPLGFALSWAGVLHWLLHGLGAVADYRPVFHATAQIQGFLMCFAVGFLFTAIPRRTVTPPPSAVEMAVALGAPVITVVAAWYERWLVSQVAWLVLALSVIAFALRRLRSAAAGRRPPNSFLWVPLALTMGLVGSALVGAQAFLGQAGYWIHDLGRLLLLQGMFLGLVLGVGGMVLPLITCGDAPPDSGELQGDRRRRLGHALAGLALLSSFWVENSGHARAGAALRFAAVTAVLLCSARIWRLPRVPGAHRRLVWIAAWMLPLGYLLLALYPQHRAAGLHVVFIGGFALLTFSVALHVTLAHGGHLDLVKSSPWPVPAFGGLMLVALILRALVDLDAGRFYLWLGAAAASFLAATILWAVLALPRLRPGAGRPTLRAD